VLVGCVLGLWGELKSGGGNEEEKGSRLEKSRVRQANQLSANGGQARRIEMDLTLVTKEDEGTQHIKEKKVTILKGRSKSLLQKKRRTLCPWALV